MRFQVPQYIEVEDKIFGPFTLKQFIYMAGGAGGAVAAFSLLPSFLAILIAVPLVLLSAALTFVKINNRPFILAMESFFKYLIGEKLYIWKKEEKTVEKKNDVEKLNMGVYIPKLSDSKLRDLSWSISVKKDPVGNREAEQNSAE